MSLPVFLSNLGPASSPSDKVKVGMFQRYFDEGVEDAYNQGLEDLTAQYLENKEIGSLEYLQERARLGDASAIDRLYNYNLSEMSAEKARNWTAEREDNAYQRLVKDLKSAGINPYYALQGASPISSSSSGFGFNSSTATSEANNVRTNQTKIEVARMQTMSRIISSIVGSALGVVRVFARVK